MPPCSICDKPATPVLNVWVLSLIVVAQLYDVAAQFYIDVKLVQPGFMDWRVKTLYNKVSPEYRAHLKTVFGNIE